MMNTRNLKSRIYGFEVRCAGIISQGLVSGKGKQPILKQLKQELVAFRSTVKLHSREVNQLWLMCLSSYQIISGKVWGKRTDNVSVYNAIKRLMPTLEHIKNEVGQGIEERKKSSYLANLLDDGIFYLCSYHTNAAKDHAQYQGKIYVSENWRERCIDSEDRKRVAAYIKNHKCLTVEEICSAPVYMVTRPNCQHYFTRVDIDEVMHNSVKKLLKTYDMVKTDKSSYEYNQYRNYYERLKLLMSLRGICPCYDLEADIRQTRKITKKWLSMVSR